MRTLTRFLFCCHACHAKINPFFIRPFTTTSTDFKQKYDVSLSTIFSKQSQSKISNNSWKSYINLLKPQFKLLALGSVLMLGSTSISMYVPHGIGQVLDIASNSTPTDALFSVIATLSSIFVVGTGINFGRVAIFKWANENIVNGIRKTLFNSFIQKDLFFFDKTSTGDIISRLSSDASIAGKSITSNLSEGIKHLGQGAVGAFMMYSISPKLCAYLLVILPPIAIIAMVFGKLVKKVSFQSQESLAKSLSFADERLSNIRTVKIFGKEQQEMATFSDKISSLLSLARKESILSGSTYALTGLMANAALIALLYLSSTMVVSNEITIGSLSAFLMYTVYVGTSVSGLSSTFLEYFKGLGAFERIVPFLKSKEKGPMSLDIIPKTTSYPISSKMIQLESIQFSYPEKDTQILFKGSTCDLAISGRITVVVGSSGSGKSTLISLLLKLYPLSHGNILLANGYLLNNLCPGWIKGFISVVSQEPVLFHDTIAGNISYGNQNATLEQIQLAAKLANADSFIEKLENKYQTIIGERGCSLSGGQKQRIAIARAILRNSPVLILDEPTSALDVESEKIIHASLINLAAKGLAIVIITHKTSTMAIAHRQLTIKEDGTINEDSGVNLN